MQFLGRPGGIPKCFMGNPATDFCKGQKCKSFAFICADQSCDCRKNHKKSSCHVNIDLLGNTTKLNDVLQGTWLNTQVTKFWEQMKGLINASIQDLTKLSGELERHMTTKNQIQYVLGIRPAVKLINEDNAKDVKGQQMFELCKTVESGKYYVNQEVEFSRLQCLVERTKILVGETSRLINDFRRTQGIPESTTVFVKCRPTNINPKRSLKSLEEMRQQGTLSITVVDELMIESLFHSHCVPEYINYGKAINDVTRKMRDSDENKRGDIRNDYSDGSTEIKFVDGHSRYIKGNYILTKFQNGNMEQFLPDGTKIEYFADKMCDIITFKSGFKICRFKNGQVDFYYPDRPGETRDPTGNYYQFVSS